MAMDAKTLCLRIDEAFGSMPQPREKRLPSEDTSGSLEAEQIRSKLRGRHWRDIPFEALSEIPSALSFLNPAEYRFYLPAFMVFSVADFDQANPIPHEVVQSLTLPDLADLERTRKLGELHSEVQPFSNEEWQQVLATLEENYRNGVLERAFFERVSGFDDSQNYAILQFLEYMVDSHSNEFLNGELQRAIERYWRKKAGQDGMALI